MVRSHIRLAPVVSVCKVPQTATPPTRLINFAYKVRKFKVGICCGNHLAVTYGAELLYLPPSKLELAFLTWIKSQPHIGYRAMNHAVTIIHADRAD